MERSMFENRFYHAPFTRTEQLSAPFWGKEKRTRPWLQVNLFLWPFWKPFWGHFLGRPCCNDLISLIVMIPTIIFQTPITDFKLQCREISRESQVFDKNFFWTQSMKQTNETKGAHCGGNTGDPFKCQYFLSNSKINSSKK